MGTVLAIIVMSAAVVVGGILSALLGWLSWRFAPRSLALGIGIIAIVFVCAVLSIAAITGGWFHPKHQSIALIALAGVCWLGLLIVPGLVRPTRRSGRVRSSANPLRSVAATGGEDADLLAGAIASQSPKPRDPAPAIADLAPHFPDLEILAQIGQGGMGAVYRANRRSDGQFLALKIVRGDDDSFANRFAREAEALTRLDHPHIIAIRGHGRTGPWCWLLMDLVDGANLREVLATGRLSAAQTLALVPPLCAALQYAHDQGVVHRDIKPENILIDAAGAPRIADFGLAKLRDANASPPLTGSGAVLGTAHYMAPEQVEGAGEVDHRADIYAFGVVLYELLTGRLPIGRFEVPSQRASIDVRIDEVVLKALERDPERRWQQAGHVGRAMEEIRDPLTPDERTRARRASGRARPGRGAWRSMPSPCCCTCPSSRPTSPSASARCWR